MHHWKFGALQLTTAFLSLALLVSGCRSCDCSAAGTGTGADTRADTDTGAGIDTGTRTGGAGANQCPFFRSVIISPLSQAVGEIVNVDIRVHDLEGDEVEVRVTSSCGHVADPIQTGSSMTTVGCEKANPCSISISLSDDGFAPHGCNGTTPGSLSTTKINCHP
jgi:hypothetical protein